MSLLVLSAKDVREIVSAFTTTYLQDLMERVFLSISQTRATPGQDDPDIQTPHRTAIEMESHTTLFMPARISCSQTSLKGTSIKVVSVPRQPDDIRGLPATTLVLNEDTGAVEAVVNARELTALRNAAGSLLSTTLVGVQRPENIVLFGSGKQAESHINVFLRHYPTIKTCTIINRTLNERALGLYKSAIASFTRVTFHLLTPKDHGSGSIKDAVQTADIIVCATPSASPLFPSSWVKTGTHVILIGSYKPSMQEVEESLVQRAIPATQFSVNQRIHQALIVDSREACLKEAGDLIRAGVDQTSMLEIGELILKKKDQSFVNFFPPEVADGGKESTLDFSSGPITMFKSVGVGLQDVVMAKAVVSHAKTIVGAGTLIEHYDATY